MLLSPIKSFEIARSLSLFFVYSCVRHTAFAGKTNGGHDSVMVVILFDQLISEFIFHFHLFVELRTYSLLGGSLICQGKGEQQQQQQQQQSRIMQFNGYDAHSDC